MDIYSSLQLREIFNLEFLRWLSRKIKAQNYALKGGVNLRFFFNSFRYSEDMDLDVSGIRVGILKDTVMGILQAPSFQAAIKPFGEARVVPPDISRAKQTETTQRFKLRLITASGEDLFTKVEFSRRGFKGETAAESISDIILRSYKMPPLLVSHYIIESTITQKIEALATRSIIQARDIFDLYILSSQYNTTESQKFKGGAPNVLPHINKLIKARDNIFEITLGQFRDTVLSYLAPEDQETYKTAASWDEIRLKAANFIDELKKKYA